MNSVPLADRFQRDPRAVDENLPAPLQTEFLPAMSVPSDPSPPAGSPPPPAVPANPADAVSSTGRRPPVARGSSPPAPARRLPGGLMLLVLAVTALVFLPTLAGGFLGDDFVYIARFRELPWTAWPALFFHDWSGGLWGFQLHELRPFAALSFMGDARLFGGWAPGYHLTNLLLHLIATALATRGA